MTHLDFLTQLCEFCPNVTRLALFCRKCSILSSFKTNLTIVCMFPSKIQFLWKKTLISLFFGKNIFFKISFASALKHFVFRNFENTTSQLSYALSSDKNIKNWLIHGQMKTVLKNSFFWAYLDQIIFFVVVLVKH